MSDRNQQKNSRTTETNKGQGMQGIDKAPSEETSHTLEHFINETQKGKNKVDGDPSKESDHPIEQSDDL